MNKKDLIIKLIEDCRITMNEARVLQDLEPVQDARYDYLYAKGKGGMETMKGYKKSIHHKPELIQVMDALDQLKKEYTITKRIEKQEEDYKVFRSCTETVWDVEEKVK
ncbi:TPA: hypothetical protein QFT23_003139 [Bacillus cereus]|nr:hypothetical protein [Bacillus cereus]